MPDADPSTNYPTSPPSPVAPYEQAAPLQYATAWLPAPYASARPRARVIIALSWAMIAVHVLLVWPFIEMVRYWRRYDPEAEGDGGAWLGMSAADLAGVGLGIVFILLSGVGVVFWLMWVHRTYRNLRALGAEGLRYSPRWAVGYYFIPILNLFRPYQVMSETWRASDARYDGGSNWKSLAAPALLGWWWALHLVSIVVHSTSSMGLWSEEPRTLLALAWVDLSLLAFDAVLLLVEIRLVRDLTHLQEQRADAVGFPR